MHVITFGGAMTVLEVPDKNGILADVVLGYDTLQGKKQIISPSYGNQT